jgi:hypothetical protein
MLCSQEESEGEDWKANSKLEESAEVDEEDSDLSEGSDDEAARKERPSGKRMQGEEASSNGAVHAENDSKDTSAGETSIF